MKLEFLPTEILFDLFDYLNGVDLLRAFYGLNYHFNFLLYKKYRFYRFKFNSISKHNFDMICQQHLPFIIDQVVYLSLSDDEDTPEEINLFRSYIPSFSQFSRLRSLSLFYLHSYHTLLKIVDECHHLGHLTYLNFYSYSSHYRYGQEMDLFQPIVNSIWNLSTLTHCNVDISIAGQDFFSVPTTISRSLKYLNMYDNKVKWNQLNELFQNTPELKCLSIKIFSCINDDYIPYSFLTLIDLKINIYHTRDTTKIISFLQNTPNLYRLNITLWSKFIDGHQWKEIICNYLPKLKVFQLRMNDTFDDDDNIQEQANQLINSFRSSFWIDKHQWFFRCIISGNTIHLYTLSKLFHYNELKCPDWLQSTCPHDNQQEFYNEFNYFHDQFFFKPIIPSNIYLPNIRELRIELPINDQFWSIVPSLKRLNSLSVKSYSDTFQSQLQFLLDQASRLRHLDIYQDESLSFQLSLFELTNTTVDKLRLFSYHFFNEEECFKLSRSSLGVQCQILYVRVKYLESIIILVENIIHLRALFVRGPRKKNWEYSAISKENVQVPDLKTINKVDSIQWLKDHLPVTCSIGRDSYYHNGIQIWIQ